MSKSHWRTLDHVLFLMMLPFILLGYLLAKNETVIGIFLLLFCLWFGALIYDVMESIEENRGE